ncbi:hypothetical protein MKW98_027386, partial [Papaver atlanticum]
MLYKENCKKKSVWHTLGNIHTHRSFITLLAIIRWSGCRWASQATAARLATTVSGNKGSSKPKDDCVLLNKIDNLSKIIDVLKD